VIKSISKKKMKDYDIHLLDNELYALKTTSYYETHGILKYVDHIEDKEKIDLITE